MMANETIAGRLAASGQYNDQQEYNSLKESHEREIEGTRRFYERMKRVHGEAGAREILRRKGHNLNLLK